jgi:hypothetical protein
MEQIKSIRNKSKKVITLLLTLGLLIAAIPAMGVSADTVEKGSLTLSVDKTVAGQGDIITATLSINNIKNFAGYQANIKYDPTVLQPIIPFGDDFLPYLNLTTVETGTLLVNTKFNPLDVVFHDVDVGILSFGRSYLQLASYRNSGSIETTGSIAVVRFRVLRSIPTEIYFKNTNILPTGFVGTAIYNYDGEQTTYYDIIQPGIIFSGSSSTPKVITPGPTSTPVVNAVPEDINGDRAVNMADVVLIAGCFNAISTSPNYNKKCDINNDGSINMADVVRISLKFNYTY